MSHLNPIKTKIIKISRFFLISFLIVGWVFSGWPGVWQNFLILPKVEKVQAAQWLESWEYRKKIIIDNTKIYENLNDFPIRVYLNEDEGLGFSARSDGYDIRFTSSDGITLLKYEREDFTINNNKASGNFWIKIPTISSSIDTEFYIYYGNSIATDGADPNSVWDTNTIARYDMQDLTTSTINDSTINSNSGSKRTINQPIETDGKLGKAQSFNGVDDYINALSMTQATTLYTVQGWIKSDLIAKNNDHNTYGFTVFSEDGTGYPLWLTVQTDGSLAFSAFSSSSSGTRTGAGLITPNNWHHVAVSADKAGLAKIYVDGQEVLSFNCPGNSGNWSGKFYIGDLRANRQIVFSGPIDEVRVSNIIRSNAWIWASFHSENDSLITFGIEEVAGLPYPPILYQEDGINQIAFNNIRQNSTTPIFRVSSVTIDEEFDLFELELNTTSDFTGNSYTQTFNDTYVSDVAYNLLADNLSPALPTTNNITYYVRLRASADSGNSWGLWSTENHPTWTYTYKNINESADWFQTSNKQFETGVLDGTNTINDSVYSSGGIEATGGIVTEVDNYTIHTFTTHGAFTISSGIGEVEYLVVAGGGGTGPRIQGGGGGGGVIEDVTTLGSGIYSIIVGDGGAGALTTVQSDLGSNGENSVFSDIATAIGGGRGGAANNVNGAAGGSGGGARGNATAQGGSSTLNQGNNGGNNTSSRGGAGGGGAGQVGQNGQSPAFAGGNGGDGIASDISGVLTYYGGGGAGGAGDGHGKAYGGLGGGGDGGQTALENGQDGAPSTGGGGGGGGFTGGSNAYSGSGGSGIVIIRYVSSATEDTIMSSEIDFDSVLGQDSWGQIIFSTTETNGDVLLSIYYTNTTSCDTIIPNGVLLGNEEGFDAINGPIDISNLNTITYNQICLKATLINTDGTPYLNDWMVTWAQESSFSNTIEIRAQDYITSISTITFPEGAPGSIISEPYNNIDGLGNPQVFGNSGIAKPVATLYNNNVASLRIWYHISNFSDNIVAEEYFLINDKNAACSDANCITQSVVFNSDNDTEVTIASGDGNEKDLYLKIILSEIAGKSGNSILTILGETP